MSRLREYHKICFYENNPERLFPITGLASSHREAINTFLDNESVFWLIKNSGLRYVRLEVKNTRFYEPLAGLRLYFIRKERKILAHKRKLEANKAELKILKKEEEELLKEAFSPYVQYKSLLFNRIIEHLKDTRKRASVLKKETKSTHWPLWMVRFLRDL